MAYREVQALAPWPAAVRVRDFTVLFYKGLYAPWASSIMVYDEE